MKRSAREVLAGGLVWAALSIALFVFTLVMLGGCASFGSHAYSGERGRVEPYATESLSVDSFFGRGVIPESRIEKVLTLHNPTGHPVHFHAQCSSITQPDLDVVLLPRRSMFVLVDAISSQRNSATCYVTAEDAR